MQNQEWREISSFDLFIILPSAFCLSSEARNRHPCLDGFDDNGAAAAPAKAGVAGVGGSAHGVPARPSAGRLLGNHRTPGARKKERFDPRRQQTEDREDQPSAKEQQGKSNSHKANENEKNGWHR